MKSIQTFFILKVWTRKKHQNRLDPNARILPKLHSNEVLAEVAYNLHIKQYFAERPHFLSEPS